MMSRVTIIPEDSFCSVDGVGYNDVDMTKVPANIHAVQWFGEAGWIEYKENSAGVKPNNQPIESMTDFKPVLDSWAIIHDAHVNPLPPPPPEPPTAEQNKITAENYLAQTDWTQLPSVSDPELSSPHLLNAAEFAAYRQQLRAIAINPVAGDIDWPTRPNSEWSSV